MGRWGDGEMGRIVTGATGKMPVPQNFEQPRARCPFHKTNSSRYKKDF
ncbi:hypothetical protein BJP36_40405 [Moorena producens JHB]|uniref:Uncharacterized protein n=1 Tax=Moorena producens (strain JHB) TaxID=1454205 RepID=A0A9Q9SS71_MOOP1|nr:hypothetical protein [Moorena producens]WAN68638.1 hypothetical protein BJP36_40405 [Moorena producens JHB]